MNLSAGRVSLSTSSSSDALPAETLVVLLIQVPHHDLVQEALCRLENDPGALHWDDTSQTWFERVCASVAAFSGGLVAGWLWL